jgi:hypothetical protein
MLVKIKKAMVNTSRGLCLPGRYLIPLPGDEAARLVERGDVEVIESAAVVVLKPFGPKTREHLPVGSLAVELPVDEALEAEANGHVRIVTGRKADEAHELGRAETQTPAEKKAAAEADRKREAEIDRRSALRRIVIDHLQRNRPPASLQLEHGGTRAGRDILGKITTGRVTREEIEETIREVAVEMWGRGRAEEWGLTGAAA